MPDDAIWLAYIACPVDSLGCGIACICAVNALNPTTACRPLYAEPVWHAGVGADRDDIHAEINLIQVV